MFILRVAVSAAAHLAHGPPPGRERFRITSAASPHRSHGAVPPPHTMHSNASLLPFIPRLACALLSPHHEHHAVVLVAAANASRVVHPSIHPAHLAHRPSPIFANPSPHRSHRCVALAHAAQ